MAPDAVEPDWLGAPMFFSHHGAKKNRALVRRSWLRARGSRRRRGARGPARRPVPVGRRPPTAGDRRWLTGRAGIPGPAAASLPAAIREAIVAQARAEYPNEACGLIVGDAAGGRRWPRAALRADPQQGRVALSLRDRPARPAAPDHRDRRRRRGLLGIVHSHTHTPAVPSPTDIGLAFYPDALYLLVSLSDDEADPATGAPGLRAWRIVDGERATRSRSE